MPQYPHDQLGTDRLHLMTDFLYDIEDLFPVPLFRDSRKSVGGVSDDLGYEEDHQNEYLVDKENIRYASFSFASAGSRISLLSGSVKKYGAMLGRSNKLVRRPYQSHRVRVMSKQDSG
jgi:hypothetical protein